MRKWLDILVFSDEDKTVGPRQQQALQPIWLLLGKNSTWQEAPSWLFTRVKAVL